MLTVNSLSCTFLHKTRLVRLYQVLLVVVLSYGFNATANTTTCPTDGVLYVQQNSAELQDGTSWANAFATVQDALAVTDACEIWVAAGVYYPDEGGGAINDVRTSTFQLKNDVAIYGGFAGTETMRSQRNWEANVTVLSGDLDQNDGVDGEGAATLNGNNSYHVVTGNGVTGTAKLDGVVITAGKADGSGNPDNRGGGMYNTSSSPTLTQMIFSGNSAFKGGGMYNRVSSSPTLSQVTFSDNSATEDGGGMFNLYSNPTLSQVTFSDNSATEDGGGMFNDEVSNLLTLSNVTFSENSASNGNGGGMLNRDSSNPTLTNVTFSENSASNGNGGGMFNEGGSSPTLSYVTFSGNSATLGGGIYNDIRNPTLTHTIIANSTSGGDCAGNAPTSNGYNLDSDGSCGLNSTGDLSDVDPQLGSLADNGGATQTHALLPGSPAIDAGDNANCPATDQRGITRPLDGDNNGTATCDIGAVEAPAIASYSIADASVSEGTGGSTNLAFTITRTLNDTGGTVDVSTSDGTATAGSDYTALTNETVSFAIGETSKTINVSITTDSLNEADETLTVTLSNAVNGGMGDATATGTIEDDDDATLTLSIAAAAISESAGSAATTATVTRNTDTTNTLVINLTSSDTSEVTVPATVTIAAGQTAATFELAAVDDALVDGTQTVVITATATDHADGTDSVEVSDDDSDPGNTDSPTDAEEQAAPNNGDGNNDGIRDDLQNNVASFPSAVSGAYFTVDVTNSPSCTPINNTGSTTEAALGGDPDNFDYFAGLLEFTLDCDQADIVLYLHGLPSAPDAIRKYSRVTNTWYTMPGAGIETVTIDGQMVYKASYTLTDGGVGDDDGATNGTIVDPVGPAWAVTGGGGNGAGSNAQNIPVFGPFGLLAILIGLLWFGRRPLTQNKQG